MWTMILSLEPIVEELRPAFTQPSFAAGCDLLLAWIMCLGKHTLRRRLLGEDHTERGLIAPCMSVGSVVDLED